MALQYPHKDDTELLTFFYKDGNNEWLGILLQRYTGLLLGVCMKYLKNEDDAKDAVQQIFLKVINELQKYKVDYFKSWLYMVAKNHCLMKLRENKKQRIEIKGDISLEDDEQSTKENQLKKETDLTQLETAITLLNNEQRLCISLFYLEKKSYNDIVMLTNYSLMQVKSSIQNGKRNLKIYMERLSQHE